ncbi:MAG: hypothetical protein U0X93_05155 [Anaerolineales bacterium]
METTARKNNAFLNSCLIFVIFIISGAVLGFLAGSIAADISNTSALSSWELLDSPQKFETIVDVTSQTIWAQSEDGKLYSWNFICYGDIQCMQWVETSDVPNDIHDFGENPMEKSTSCKTTSSNPVKQPPGKLVECARGWYAGPEYGQVTYYALLEDGKIWALQTSSSLIVDTVLPIVYSFGGLVLSIIGFFIFIIWRKIKSKQEITKSDTD